MRVFGLWIGIAALGCAFSRSAAAAEGDADARADALFRDGLTLFDARQYAQACPKLAESFRLEPATGSLLALAACHEAQGKTASAWVEYGAVVDRAHEEGREDRADAARQHRAGLEPRLAKLTIGMPPEVASTPGLVVTRDGIAVGGDSIAAPVPVDPGEHRVEASAPGRQSWSTTVALWSDGASASVVVPPLAELATPATSPHSGDWDRDHASLRVAGIATGVAGLLALGVAGYLTSQAIRQNDDSRSDCSGNVCGASGRQERFSAIASAKGATVATVIGSALVVGGVALFILGRPREAGPSLTATPAVDTRGGGLVFHGTF
jgi:hypothetical protein